MWAQRHLSGLSQGHLQVIDMLTQHLVNNLLHEPTVRLKHHASGDDGSLYAQVVRDIFALGEPR